MGSEAGELAWIFSAEWDIGYPQLGHCGAADDTFLEHSGQEIRAIEARGRLLHYAFADLVSISATSAGFSIFAFAPLS